MFYYLEGTITIIDPGLAVIDIGGAGYACFASVNTLSRLEIGVKTRLYTYCNIKEDAFDIYGFYDAAEKRAFEMLIGVSGVGPKAALSILSVNSPESLALAVVNDDTAAITLASGVGKKLAQRIVLELKDKIAKSGNIPAGTGASGIPADRFGSSDEASLALLALGYTQSEISALLRGLETETMTTQEIIRAALDKTAANLK